MMYSEFIEHSNFTEQYISYAEYTTYIEPIYMAAEQIPTKQEFITLLEDTFILTLLKKYIDVEHNPCTDVTINVELQKVFDRNSKRKPKTEIYYILCVTVKKMNGETCNLKHTMEIHNVKGSGLLYKSCKIYAYDSLKQFILK